MTVYVDDVEHAFGQMLMCHMWADTLDELFAMADRIGVQRKWLQGHPELSQPRYRKASWVHFDIAKSKKELAIQHGAVLTDQFGPLEHTAKLLIKNENPQISEIGRKRLKRVEQGRARRAAETNPQP